MRAAPSGDGQGFQQAAQHTQGQPGPTRLSSAIQIRKSAERFLQPARNSNKWEAPAAFAEDWFISFVSVVKTFFTMGQHVNAATFCSAVLQDPALNGWALSIQQQMLYMKQQPLSFRLVFVIGCVPCLLTVCLNDCKL